MSGKKGFFGWEYKSKHKNLLLAYDQLLQYREALKNPPLLAVSDMGILDIRTNFTRHATKKYTVDLQDLGNTENRRVVENLFWAPEKLQPGQDVEHITNEAAGELADIAHGMRSRGLNPSDVAKFLDRVVFCLFAQDVGLLQEHVFTKITDRTHADSRWFSREVFKLFEAMNTGGDCALVKIPHFNGDLFSDVRPLELVSTEVQAIRKVARLNWGEVDASILGTLFERGMDPTKEAEIGTHYTKRSDISLIVDPVVMGPLRGEWESVRSEVDGLLDDLPNRRDPAKPRPKSPKKDPVGLRRARTAVIDFHQRLQDVSILDPACGSGNFLFVSLQKLKDLEKEVLVYASERDIADLLPAVGPWQLHGIEKSPYAYDLARMSIWIGWLQWTRANGFMVDWEPILRTLGNNLRNTDAILDLSNPGSPQKPDWPPAEFIVGNPPFLGGREIWSELGIEYGKGLARVYQDDLGGKPDLCCYWFERARKQVERGLSKRVGLLATGFDRSLM